MENQKTKNTFSVRAICFTAIMAALIFVFTFTFKIPLGTGYTHIGDSIIFLSIALLGAKKSSIAAGIGAALADLIGGYSEWIVPTFLIKFIMVLICGLFAEKLIKNKFAGYIVGAIIGGAFQICGYTVAKLIIFDKAYALTTLPELVIQTIVGIIVAVVFISVFNKTKVTDKLRKMAE
ncbi:MAG: ECF transporter S component [Eubacterium sp.]|nr:ECF transporter S component [Eubacterium sp.]